MVDFRLPDIDQYTTRAHRRRIRRRTTACLAAAVIFCTAYALILPAVTIEKECPIPEHTHTEECYTQIVSKTSLVPVCTPQSLGVHQHIPECSTNCGYADFVIHTHDSFCYEDDGRLWCPLAEIHEHIHDEGCYVLPSPHVHDNECYTQEGELTCTRQEPEGDPEPVLICERPEISCHQHTNSCYDSTGVLICGQTQILAHQHASSCFTVLEADTTELTCGMTEHTHTSECVPDPEESDSMYEEPPHDSSLSDKTDFPADESSFPTETEQDASDKYNSIAEPCFGTNWLLLRNSGWWERYSGYSPDIAYSYNALPFYGFPVLSNAAAAPSSVQIDTEGGTRQNAEDGVSVSKTIAGTDIENVFDITLTVQTPQIIERITQEPDMAVVIVMDISNTMKEDFDGETRYSAAMEAAETFLDNFAANNSLGISKVGYVAFNTDAHQIFGLQPCTDSTQANALKSLMLTSTGKIIDPDEYSVSHSRFTNIEAGLKMANDMLNAVSNSNKFIIFLSDGFPTTYIRSDYSGYDPYDSTGRFYDHVLNRKCLYGNSYSDEAAIRARKIASSIKDCGTTIFSIGVDVGGQTIQTYITKSENASGFSVVDRTGTSYEIGDASSAEAYKNWLRNGIGSGYYYDSTNTQGLKAAYDTIFQTIQQNIEIAAAADWVTEDPIPTMTPDAIEFIGMYAQDGALQWSLSGSHENNGENSASYITDSSTIRWDLKESGYSAQVNGNTTLYTYQLRYRVRLKNEDPAFAENQVYETNGRTTLQYRVIRSTDGVASISDPKTIEFPIPSVHGFLEDLTFLKQDNHGNCLPGAQFTLRHDPQCGKCRGDGTTLLLSDRTALSDEDGSVTFRDIPSGHSYLLQETKIPSGYSSDGTQYTVTVRYDQLTVTAAASGGNEIQWEGIIVNNTYYELPATGGNGTVMYTIGGILLILTALFLLYRYNNCGVPSGPIGTKN